MAEEMISMTIYADSTKQFTEKECDANNLLDVEFPRRIVFDFYKKYMESDYGSFNKWLEEYTADDTADLWHFAMMNGFMWHRTDEPDEYMGSIDGYEIEICPNCESEIELRWDINKDGFQAYCPHCGKMLMLCDACQHRFGDCFEDCDWHKDRGCKFSKKG